jgi:hypothetical protein
VLILTPITILPLIGLISEADILLTNKYILYFQQITGIESYRIERTRNVTVHRMGWENQNLAAWHLLGKLKRRFQKPQDEKGN